MANRARSRHGLACAVAIASSYAAASVAPARAAAPSMVALSPFGHPFLLAPARLDAVVARTFPVTLGSGTFQPGSPARPVGRALVARPGPTGGAVASSDEDDDEDDETAVPTHPGGFRRGFAKVPDATPFLKRVRTMGPHLQPDVEYPMTDTTSAGVLATMDRFRPGTIGATLPRISASIPARVTLPGRPRDVGLGATFEFKLGK